MKILVVSETFHTTSCMRATNIVPKISYSIAPRIPPGQLLTSCRCAFDWVLVQLLCFLSAFAPKVDRLLINQASLEQWRSRGQAVDEPYTDRTPPAPLGLNNHRYS